MQRPHWGISVSILTYPKKGANRPKQFSQIHASVIGHCRDLLAATQDEFYLDILQQYLSDFPEAWNVLDCPAIVLPLNPTIGGKEAQAC